MPIRGSPNGANHLRPQAGRDRLEQVVAINRNAWSQSIGMAGRDHPVRAPWGGTLITGLDGRKNPAHSLALLLRRRASMDNAGTPYSRFQHSRLAIREDVEEDLVA